MENLVGILKGGFKRGEISYIKKEDEFVVYQHSKLFWFNTKNKLISCKNIETLKEIDKRCELGIFKKTSEN